MNTKLAAKILLFQVLDELPEHLGIRIYHFLQSKFQQRSLEQKIKAAQGTYQQLQRLTDTVGISLKDKKILEIGSGWLPIMPYFITYLGGAKKVETYDLYRHYNSVSIKKLNLLFVQQFGIEIQNTTGEFSLPPEVEYYPNKDLSGEILKNIDVIYSRFVLEHVSPDEIKKMHLRFKNSLDPGTLVIHFISPSDHRAYVDKSLSLQDFLRFSKTEWKKKCTKFDYHNRLRLPEYLEIFKELGYYLEHVEFEIPSKNSTSYEKFKAVSIHEDFAGFTEEELMAGSINLVLKV
ncbi:hypothetical protein [Salinimicrobium soli]|uniref:hypothetical protein n=1 Tax=Salinimicrobium soli TaxID=1254399 RepID=UPI003AAA6B2B